MTKQEIIKAFEQAEKDWSKKKKWWNFYMPKHNETDCGFCAYFILKHNIDSYVIEGHLEPLWIKYRTTEHFKVYHFNNREERLEAIRKVLNDLRQ